MKPLIEEIRESQIMFCDFMPGEYSSHNNRKTVFFNRRSIMAEFLVRVLPNKNDAILFSPSRSSVSLFKLFSPPGFPTFLT